MTKNTFDPNTDIPSLSDQVHLVTGGSAGIGFGIVAHLLQHNPSKIYLLSNKEEHAQSAIDNLKDWGDVDKVEWVQTDFADLKQTNEVAQMLKRKITRLDSLVSNAGLGVGKYWETKDGLENHFQVNYLSQLLLIMTLLPTLLHTSTTNPTSSPRLVLMSSDLHRGANASTNFASKDEINTDLGATNLYNRSKLAQVLAVRRLDRDLKAGKYGAGKIYVNATHPGGVSTDQQEQAVEAYGTVGKLGVKAVRPLLSDPVKTGCRSGLFAAVGRDVVEEGITGQYIVPERKVTEPSKQAMDEGLGDRLWVLGEGMLRDVFGGRVPWETVA